MKRGLRKGWTTGACAAAAAKAAFARLHGGPAVHKIAIRLPGGKTPSFDVLWVECTSSHATAAVVKDAGDDPDVTHGATVRVTVAAAPAGSGLHFIAGDGVGTVTLPGLAVPPGEPAINPGPRAQIRQNIEDAAFELGVSPDARVTIAIPGGEILAARTLNGRLGIVGGLSILGTTGVVVPFSCSAWAESIRRGVAIAKALELCHLAAATGRTSEAALRQRLSLPDQAILEMGDMAGTLFDALKPKPPRQLTLAGGPAKLLKLACGARDLHSRAGGPKLDALADRDLAQAFRDAPTIAGALTPALADRIAAAARHRAQGILGCAVTVWVVDRQGAVVGACGS